MADIPIGLVVDVGGLDCINATVVQIEVIIRDSRGVIQSISDRDGDIWLVRNVLE